jgi:SpoIIAA-like
MADKNQFSIAVEDGYLRLKTWGELDTEGLDAPVNAALDLSREKGITKLLDDVREVDAANVSISVQTKGVGIMWRLRQFDKVAILFGSQRLSGIFFQLLDTVHLNVKIRGFYDEAEAIAWLKSDKG